MNNFEYSLDFNKKVEKDNFLRVKEWSLITDLSDKLENELFKHLLENKSSFYFKPTEDVNFELLYQIQFKSYLVYRIHDLIFEPLFLNIEKEEEKGIKFNVNQKALFLISQYSISGPSTRINRNKDYLTKFLLFNFLIRKKCSVTLNLEDIRRLLFLENKYKSAGDLRNKVLKKIIDSFPLDVKIFQIQSKPKSIQGFVFQSMAKNNVSI